MGIDKQEAKLQFQNPPNSPGFDYPSYLHEDQFESMAICEPDEVMTGILLHGEVCIRRLRLACVFDEHNLGEKEIASRLKPDKEAWTVLDDMEEKGIHINNALLYPTFRAWTKDVIYRGSHDVCSTSPLWFRVGYFASFVLATAVRNNIDTTLSVPMHKGSIMLPGVGMARIPDEEEWAMARVSARGNTLTITKDDKATDVLMDANDEDTADWQPIRLYAYEGNGFLAELVIDDLDHYRINSAGKIGDEAPARLSVEEISKWRIALDEAWTLLEKDHPAHAKEIASWLRSIVDRPSRLPFRGSSASSEDYGGSVILSKPESPAYLAESLVHEIAHNKLNTFLDLYPLVDKQTLNKDAIFYAPWRPDPRPGLGLLHGVYSFFAVTEFWRRHCQSNFEPESGTVPLDLAQFELALWRYQTHKAAQPLRTFESFTHNGWAFVDRLLTKMESWFEEPVAPYPQEKADIVAAAHYGMWRAHHLQPEDEAVKAAAEAWLDGQAPPEEALSAKTIVVADERLTKLTVGILMRFHLADHPALKSMVEDPGIISRHVADATPADVLYASGDYKKARTLYIDELSQDARSPRALVGLGLALQKTDKEASKALLERPELIRAVQARLESSGSNPTPSVELAEWLGSKL